MNLWIESTLFLPDRRLRVKHAVRFGKPLVSADGRDRIGSERLVLHPSGEQKVDIRERGK